MYPLVRIPHFANKDYFEFTKNEAKDYLKWFLKIKDERVKILGQHVQHVNPNWKVDFTRASLAQLYNWFSNAVAYRPMTEEEKEGVKRQLANTPLLANVIPIPESTFTDETVSVCFDVGIYFGQTLINNVPGLKWLQKLTSTNFIYYAQPLLAMPKSKVPLNPRASIEGIARRIIDQDGQEITFEMLYDKWTEKFESSK
jgi:hypothetical protein